MKRYDEEADAFFRAAALEAGYLKEDPHSPGKGRGLWRWYRDNGIVPPEQLARQVPSKELTGLNLENLRSCE